MRAALGLVLTVAVYRDTAQAFRALAPFSVHASSSSVCSSLLSLRRSKDSIRLRMGSGNSNEDTVDYNNKVIEAFGGMLKSTDLESVDWSAAKREGLSIDEMSAALEQGLQEREWFVTGNIMPELFGESFKFQDPDVKLEGVENYARGVNKLFDPSSRAELVDCSVNSEKPNTITVTWRLSGKVNLGPGVTIKPYVVYTDLVVDPASGLVVFQEDRFSLPGWDLLLSAFLPFLQPFLTPPAPPVEELRKTFAETGSV